MNKHSKQYRRLPGLTDVHVHLRVPGGEHKEDIRSGTLAALAGGFTTILAMPNTDPPLISVATLRSIKARINEEALCEVHLFAGNTADEQGDLAALAPDTVGLKLYMNDTFGALRVDSLATLLHCFRVWPSDKVIAMHAEGRQVAVGIGLAACYNRPVHFCHISRKDEIVLIAAAKSHGLPITCEVTPHHLFLTESDAQRLGSLGDMRPKLASPTDVEALWSHIDTTIDCIATDHAPHLLTEKQSGSAGQPPGVPGLETALPLMLTAVRDGRLGMERLIALMAVNPRRIYSLPPQPDSWVDVNLEEAFTIQNETLYTKCGWSPFAGYKVWGKIKQVGYRGRPVIQNGIFLNH